LVRNKNTKAGKQTTNKDKTMAMAELIFWALSIKLRFSSAIKAATENLKYAFNSVLRMELKNNFLLKKL